MCKNYRELDRRKILNFIAARGGEVDVEEIVREGVAENTRVYAILFEETEAGHIEVTEHADMGAAKRVRLSKRPA